MFTLPTLSQAQNNSAVIIKMGVDSNYLTPDWIHAIESRMSKQKLDSMQGIRRTLTVEEKDWVTLIESKRIVWNIYRDSLQVPFNSIEVTDSIYVLLGFGGVDDAFTYQYNTVCFDLTALVENYGLAQAVENKSRIDRFFAHEFTHIIHKTSAREHGLVLSSFRDSILWECLYEGIGMYRSLTKKWLPQTGEIPAISKAALDKLYPIFVERLVRIETDINLTTDEKRLLGANLSRGSVPTKWGAFTVAIWLALEAEGDDTKLRQWIEKGPEAIVLLAKKYLTNPHLAKLKTVYP